MKKIIAVILIFAMVACMGCGGSSSNGSDSKQASDLYGVKKPVSAMYTNGNKGSYKMAFEYNSDGSYIATIKYGVVSVRYYFAKNGIITKEDAYNSSKQQTKVHYFINGVCSYSESNDYGLAIGGFNLFKEFTNTQALPTYDSEGNITNAEKISETDDCVQQSYYYHSLWAKNIPNNGVSIVRNNDGKITRTYTKYNSKYEYSPEYVYYTEYSYSDNSITMLSYETKASDTNMSNGTCQGGAKVTYNSHGSVSEIVQIKYNGISTYDGDIYTYTYDDYGLLTSVKNEASPETDVAIKYTY